MRVAQTAVDRLLSCGASNGDSNNYCAIEPAVSFAAFVPRVCRLSILGTKRYRVHLRVAHTILADLVLLRLETLDACCQLLLVTVQLKSERMLMFVSRSI